MSAADCPKCGEHIPDCTCDLSHLHAIRNLFEAQLLFLQYATTEEVKTLFPIFDAIRCRIRDQDLPKK
jgi:hypothetical protein